MEDLLLRWPSLMLIPALHLSSQYILVSFNNHRIVSIYLAVIGDDFLEGDQKSSVLWFRVLFSLERTNWSKQINLLKNTGFH